MIVMYIGFSTTNKSKQDSILKIAKEEGESIKKEKILQAKEKFLELKENHEKVINSRERKMQEKEITFKQKDKAINLKIEEYNRKDKQVKLLKENLENQLAIIEKKEKELNKKSKNQIEELEKLSGYSSEDAKSQLIKALKDEAKTDAMAFIKDIQDEAKLNASKDAKKIVIQTIQRVATEHAIENAVSVFNIDSDDIKGRIIGREGRNIRALESATGVEIIVDDTPEAIILSCFDPIRREIARLSLHQLVTDGRIHPARIEEVVSKTKKSLNDEIIETGKRTCIDLGIHGLLHLMGFSHEKENDALIMEGIEVKILKELGIPNPYEGVV